MDFGGPAVIKPVDSSGSKGVSIVRDGTNIESSLAYAFSESRSGEVIVEDYIGKSGKQICGDGYMDRGKLAFIELGDGHFHERAGLLAPFAEIRARKAALDAQRKVETILAAVGYHKGLFNLDAFITPDGTPSSSRSARCGGLHPDCHPPSHEREPDRCGGRGCLDRTLSSTPPGCKVSGPPATRCTRVR
jgi:formate-dependent phosphoribosylglycinamide formyltransferase (GAR transformylase)